MSCKTIVSWESKANADYHDSSIADECSRGIEKKKKSSTKEQQAMKTTSDMQQSFFFLLRWIKIHYCHSIHTHTCRHQMVYSWLLAYSILNAHERDQGKKKCKKSADDDGFHFLFVARTSIDNNRSFCLMNNNNNKRWIWKDL